MDQTVLRDLSYGVYITGSLDGGRPVGCVANTVFQVTSNPVTIGISLNKLNYTERCVRESGFFTLSILSENTPQEVIGKFGFQSSKDVDKFETFQYGQMGEKGFPVLREAVCSGMLCRVIQEVDVLTHTLFIGQLVEAECFSSETPMTYSYYHQVRKGKTAKNAPTFLEEADPQNGVAAKKYVCSICGYVYEGGKSDFEKLPDSWQCPICGVEKEKFVLKEKP